MSRRPTTVWDWIARLILTLVGTALSLVLAFTSGLYVGAIFRLVRMGWRLAWW